MVQIDQKYVCGSLVLCSSVLHTHRRHACLCWQAKPIGTNPALWRIYTLKLVHDIYIWGVSDLIVNRAYVMSAQSQTRSGIQIAVVTTGRGT
jgi:hypothetical protein